MENEFKNTILKKVQISRASHQKNLKILESIYGKTPYSEFKEILFRHLKIIIATNNLPTRNDYVERSLEFLANFVSLVTPQDEDIENIDEDTPLTPFLSDVVSEALKYHNVCNESVRYNACLFVRLILQNIGNQTQLDNEICDFIEEAMLERIMDRKASIRLQAVMALVRLQDPLNPDCPILKAYLTLIYDAKAPIRAEVVKNIAPFGLTIPHIIKRLKDIDSHVRSVTFKRCADLGPKHFKIVERQHVLQCGISETHGKCKKVFLEHLLPKWLNAYNGDFILLLNSLKLDADESDIVNLEEISKEIMGFFLSTVPINDMTENLPLNEGKLISLEKLSSEAVLLWNIIVNYLRQSNDLEEYLENVLPELSPFCKYIESIMDNKNEKQMEEWEYLEYQYILYNLFEIAEGYDFSDEVGRKTLHQLIMNILKNEHLQFRLMKKLVKMASQITSEDFINTICFVMSEIREPLVEIEKSVNKADEASKKFEVASLKVKLDILQGELEDALDCQEFLKANELKEKMFVLKEQLEVFNTEETTFEQVRVLKDDVKTVCRCLDLLIALLELPKIKEFSQSLTTVKDEFLMPLLNSNSGEINRRVLNCLALLSLLDEKLAEEYIKILCIPIITYRAIPNYNKVALLISVKSICDLYLVYGPKIFGDDNSSHNTTATKRKLYNNEDMEESIMNPAKLHLELIIDIILDMMDDENSDIHDTAVLCITKLILGNFPVNSAFIARIVLKWYNPLTAKCSVRFKQMLGVMIGQYTSTVKGARDVVTKAVIPILNSIAGAPKTSPLADVDVDNLLHFLAVITTTSEQMDVINTHVSLAHMLCLEILKKTNSSVVIYLSKMLTFLEVPSENVNVLKELIARVKIILEEEENLEKTPRKFVLKFLQKLKDTLNSEIVMESHHLQTVVEETENSNTVADTEVVIQYELDQNKKPDDPQTTDLLEKINEGQKTPSIDDNKQQKPTDESEKSKLSEANELKRSRNGELKKKNSKNSTSSIEIDSSTDSETWGKTRKMQLRNRFEKKSTNPNLTDTSSEQEAKEKKNNKGNNKFLLQNRQKKHFKTNQSNKSNVIKDKIIQQSVDIRNNASVESGEQSTSLKKSRTNNKRKMANSDKDGSNDYDSSDTNLENEPTKKRLKICVEKMTVDTSVEKRSNQFGNLNKCYMKIKGATNDVVVRGSKNRNVYKSGNNNNLLHKDKLNTRQTRLNKSNEEIDREKGKKTNDLINRSFTSITENTKNSSSSTNDSSRNSNNSKRTTRSKHLSQELNSSAETTLHTIIHDYSSPQYLLPDDNFSESSPRRSLRLEHSNNGIVGDVMKSSIKHKHKKNMTSNRTNREFGTRSRRKLQT